MTIKAGKQGGDAEAGIKELDALLGRGVKDPAVYRLMSLGELYLGNNIDALEHINAARQLETQSMENEIAFGRFLNGCGFVEVALNCFQHAATLTPESAEAAALATMALEKLGRRDEAIATGQHCLELRDSQAQKENLEPVQGERPTQFDTSDRSRNVISFSLFGANSYYWESAIAAASGGFAQFPEWTCRFYCGPEVPQKLCATLILPSHFASAWRSKAGSSRIIPFM